LTEIRSDILPLKFIEIPSKIPKEYSNYYNMCKIPLKGKAGTAVFSRVKPIQVIYGIENEEHNKEGRVLTCEYDKFFLVNAHMPKAGPKLINLHIKEKFEKDLNKHVKDLEAKGKPVVLAGDMKVAREEIDIYNPKRFDNPQGYSIEEKQSFNDFLAQGFVDTFRHLHPEKQQFSYFPMRKTLKNNEKGWRTDYIIVSKSIADKVESSEILDSFNQTDHSPVSVVINLA
jgi:exodeoxyribonuclease III